MSNTPAEKPSLNVVVTGVTMSGKTTVARIIAHALRKNGFEVENTDPDDNTKDGLFPIESERLREMAKGRKVKVSVVQRDIADIRQKLQESGERWGLVHKVPVDKAKD